MDTENQTSDGGGLSHRAKRRAFAAGALGLGLLIGAVALEVGVRAYLGFSYRHALDDLPSETPGDQDRTVALGEVLAPDDNPDIVYRFKPGAVGVYEGAPIRINSMGIRGEDPSEIKGADTLRIVGLGDSTMFGWKVREDERYMDLVAEGLARALGSGGRAEAIVAALPGWLAVQEVEIFHSDLLESAPDAVVIQFEINDVEIPHFLRRPNVWAPTRLYAFDALRTRAFFREFVFDLNPELIMSGHTFLTPPLYRRLEGWDALEAAYKRLKETCDRRGIALLAVIPIWEDSDSQASRPGWEAESFSRFTRLCRKLGIDLVDANASQARHADSDVIAPRAPALFFPNDSHGTPAGHAVIARAILGPLIDKIGGDRFDAERTEAALAWIDAAVGERLDPARSIGLYSTEDWSGVPVRWTQGAARLAFESKGEGLIVGYWVGHPDISASNPVEVTLALDSGARIVTRHEKGGYFSKRLDLNAHADARNVLELKVHPTFTPPGGGRSLGVGLYPLKFDGGDFGGDGPDEPEPEV